jgi:hypothetical protein
VQGGIDSGTHLSPRCGRDHPILEQFDAQGAFRPAAPPGGAPQPLSEQEVPGERLEPVAHGDILPTTTASPWPTNYKIQNIFHFFPLRAGSRPSKCVSLGELDEANERGLCVAFDPEHLLKDVIQIRRGRT